MTSNVGSDIIYRGTLGFKEERQRDLLEENEMREKVLGSLRENFKPEFLNRVDEIIIFHPLTPAMLAKIVDLQMGVVQKRLREKNIKIITTPTAKKYLSEKGFDPVYGARPLRRVIQNEILDELALRIIEGKIKEGDRVSVDVEKNKIVLKS